MSLPSVSVVVPTYERPKLLETALESITSQHYEGEIEVVVMDGSEQKSAESVVDAYPQATYYPQREHVSRQPSRIKDIAAAREVGVSVADGDYIHFLDDDDELEPDAIAAKMSALEQTPNAGVAYSAIEKADGTVKHVPDVVVGNELAFVLTNLRPPLVPSTLLVKRDVLMDCPPFQTLPHDDLGLLVELCLRTTFVYVDEPHARRNQSPSLAQSPAAQAGRLGVYERYAGLRSRLLSAELQQEATNAATRIQRQLQQYEDASTETN